MTRVFQALGVVLLVVLTWWAFGSPSSFDPVAGRFQDGSSPAVYNPVLAGEVLPDGFRQLLPRDGIQPIYDPVFTGAADVDWPAETQVIGVAADGEAKAYPVSFLNRHEMVDDFIAGDPILVTW